MKSIIICNTAADSLSKVSLNDYSVKNIPLDSGEGRVGPHGVDYYRGNIITANNYSNSISIVNLLDNREVKNIYVGAHPNDVKGYKDSLYVVCGESNSLSIIDMSTEKMIFEVSLGEYPHSIDIDQDKSIAYVSNMDGNSVSIIDCVNNKVIDTITSLECPTKILLSKDKKILYLCESYLGGDIDGYIDIISTDNNKIIRKIKVGEAPIDLWEENGKLYVTNFNEGSLSIVDVQKGREIRKIFVGGMPRGVIKYQDDIFIGNYMEGTISKINLKERIIKTITVGKEPNAMVLVDHP
ncbi:YncE family protein [Clostridium vincentii]|uniref:YNCE-like beta-propeller domain-containing protein n=1 Tax=Clostridium vincentii TaxID=52704 RepID=A0A2T0BDN0_9CLOT|nr:YncE family protein [Clostridium vincentii]PRR81932.1 hypothetical protein CLVI_21400 [Clostridium vincentii]